MTAELAALKVRMQAFINDEVIPQEPVLLAAHDKADQAMAILIAAVRSQSRIVLLRGAGVSFKG